MLSKLSLWVGAILAGRSSIMVDILVDCRCCRMGVEEKKRNLHGHFVERGRWTSGADVIVRLQVERAGATGDAGWEVALPERVKHFLGVAKARRDFKWDLSRAS